MRMKTNDTNKKGTWVIERNSLTIKEENKQIKLKLNENIKKNIKIIIIKRKFN